MQSHSDGRNVLVFKLVRKDDWAAACRAGLYSGSADDQRDGFIHLSAAHQLAGTAAKHFRGQDDLLLVSFRASDLETGLKWEESRGGDLFPHFYGALQTGLALECRELQLGEDGIPMTPEISAS